MASVADLDPTPLDAPDTGALYIEKLVRRLAASGDRPCLSHSGREVTAAALVAQVHRYAKVLDGLGIRRGDVVALLAPNRPDALAIRYAANVIGAGATYLSIPSTAEARASLIAAIDPQLLVAFPETAAYVPNGVAVPLAGIGLAASGWVSLDEAAARQSGEPVTCRAKADDLAVIVSSGGSTGVPKGSWRTFATYTAMVNVPSPQDRRQFINGPLAYLSQVLVDVTLLGGGTVVLRDHYDAIETLETISSEQITDLFLVEPQLFDLMDHPALAGADLSSLRTLSHIGASAPPTLRLRARERFGPRIVHTYGASEEGLVSILTAAEDDPANAEHFHSAGRVLPHVEVRLRRDDGTLAPVGETGSIEVRSPSMAQGYRNRPDLEAGAFHDGWYRSNDLGRIDADGYLHIYGRVVDVDMVEGRMVSPILIEDTLCRLPEVRYATVVIDREQSRRIAVLLPWPNTRIDCEACRRAVSAEHGQAVAATLLFLTPEAIPLTPQGKPDRQTIMALARIQVPGGQPGPHQLR